MIKHPLTLCLEGRFWVYSENMHCNNMQLMCQHLKMFFIYWFIYSRTREMNIKQWFKMQSVSSQPSSQSYKLSQVRTLTVSETQIIAFEVHCRLLVVLEQSKGLHAEPQSPSFNRTIFCLHKMMQMNTTFWRRIQKTMTLAQLAQWLGGNNHSLCGLKYFLQKCADGSRASAC